MANSAGDAHEYPVYGAHMRVAFPILDADGDLVTGATGLDSERSIDAGTFSDCTNEATEIATSSGMYYLDLTGAELTGKIISVIVKTTSVGAKTTPMVLYPRRLPILQSGTAQAGAAGTITLASGASAKDSFYNGLFVLITNDNPAGSQYQLRRIISYVGSTKVASIDSNWGTNPASTSTYDILIPEGYDTKAWAGVIVADPATAGIPDINVKNMNNVAATPITTIKAVQGLATDGVIPTVTNLTNAPTNGDLTATMKTSVENAVLNADMTGHQTQGSLGQAIGDPVADTNTIYKAVVTDATGATVGVDVVAVKAETASIQADTDDIQTRLPAALSANGNIKADIKEIEDQLTSGNNATLKLKQLDIYNTTGYSMRVRSDSGDALTLYSSNGGVGLLVTGDVAGGYSGASITGSAGASIFGNTDIGLYIGSNTTDAIKAESLGSGKSINAPQDIALPTGDLDDKLVALQADTDNIQTRIPAALSGDGFIKADVQSIDDELTNGYNAILKLKQLDIYHATGTPLAISTGDATADAIYVETAGTGHTLELNPTLGKSIFASRGMQVYGNDGEHTIDLLNNSTGKSINAPNNIAVSDGNLTLAAIAASVWANATRTLTSFGTLIADIWANATRTITGGTITTNSDKTGYSLTAGEEDAIVDKVWDEAIAGHLGAGSTGEKLNAAGAAGDPWTTALPGAYGAGTAGNILGNNLDTTVSSRSTLTAAGVWANATRSLTTFGTLVADIWAAVVDSAGVTTLLSRLTSGRASNLDNLDATISSRLAAIGYTAPDNAGIAAIKAKTDNLPADPASNTEVDTRLAAAAYTVPPTAGQNATAVLNAATADPIASNTKEVNDVEITGDGSTTPWGPA